MKIAMYYVESKLPIRSIFFSVRQSNSWTLKYLSYMKKKKEKYIPLTLNTWTEVCYKTKTFMSYSVQSWASWIVIWLLLLLVITSLWAPLLELFLQLRSATMRIKEVNHCHSEFDPRKHLFFPVRYKKINEVISNIQH